MELSVLQSYHGEATMVHEFSMAAQLDHSGPWGCLRLRGYGWRKGMWGKLGLEKHRQAGFLALLLLDHEALGK